MKRPRRSLERPHSLTSHRNTDLFSKPWKPPQGRLPSLGKCAGATAALLASALAPSAVAGVGQPVRAVPDAAHRAWMAAAPQAPVNLDLGLDLRWIDFVDCANPQTPHDFLDQGTSRVVEGRAGRYRVTAPHRHAFFSYGYRTAGRDRPVLLVIEYPDDDDRVISFMTHDSMRATRAHLSFSAETGVYTGGAFPLSGRMRYFTLVAWPQDDWSPLLTLNFGRVGGGGAAARFWVYAIERFHPAEVPAPADGGRTLDIFFPLAFLAERDNFGWKSPNSIEHMADYMQWMGLNRVTLMVYANQGWGAMCTIPAWDANDHGYLEKILTTLDRRGGIRMIAGIVADGMYGHVVSGGQKIADLTTADARAVILKGLDEFIDRYGPHPSLAGLAFGSMEAVGFLDLLRNKGLLEEAVAQVRRRKPEWEVITYVGNWRLQTPHFRSPHGPAAGEVVREWEMSGESWLEFAGRKVADNWRNWNRDPKRLNAIAGLRAHEMFHPDDHRLHDQYRQEPRAPLYFDTERSPARGADSPWAAIFGTFTEGHIGLHRDVNWHYTKPWTAPEFNPAGPLGVAAFARALGLRDRQTISAGGWSVKYFGIEPAFRRFAQNFRRLPPVDMADAPAPPSTDYAVVRWVRHGGRRHVAALSLIPFESRLRVDDREMELAPFDLVTWSDDGEGPPRVSGEAPTAFRQWYARRFAAFSTDLELLSRDFPAAVQEAYRRHADASRTAFAEGRIRAADDLLGYGIPGEIALRRRILSAPAFFAPRVDRPPGADPADWPTTVPIIRSEDGRGIPGHTFFPNSWTGPRDLSARLRMAHDGTHLFLLAEIFDDVRHAKDGVKFSFSREGYRNWRSESVSPDLDLVVTAPTLEAVTHRQRNGVRTTTTPTLEGYRVEVSVPLSALGVAPGEAIGFLMNVSDVDTEDNLSKHRWALKQALLIPNEPTFTFWHDARGGRGLKLAE